MTGTKCGSVAQHLPFIKMKGCFIFIKACFIRTKACFIFTKQPLIKI
ncbi:MAG: hypothetical protein LBL74_03520 [Bacteroidales bacterium]|nr:hypothetical protein [Bacteroidales bacterium]